MADSVSLDDALQKRLDAFTERIDKIHDDDEALHQTRVASRRLRELLPLLGLKADTARKLNRRLKRVTRQLGAVRELDVMLLLIRDFSRRPGYSSKGLAHVSTAVREARDGARKQLEAKLPPAKLRRLAERIERAVRNRKKSDSGNDPARPGQRPTRGWVWVADARVVRRAKTLAEAIDAAGALYAPERLHDVRIALKKLRYAMEVTMEARHGKGSPAVLALEESQDLLGRLHDVEMLVKSTRHVSVASPAPNAELESILGTCEGECRALHARYMHARRKLTAIAERIKDTSPPRRPAGRHRLAK
jgi:CHAD domain-containing protein